MKFSVKSIKPYYSKIMAALSIVVLCMGASGAVSAAPTNGSVTLGDSRPSQTTTYSLSLSTVAGTSLQCIELDLGSAADGTGSISGLDTSASTLSSSSLITAGSWTVSNAQSAAHKLRITNGTGQAPSASGNVVWGGVVNGNTANTAYYGVLTTYSNSTCATPVESIKVQFIYTAGQLVSLTVDPSFSFTVAGVASGGTVNGATTNATTTSSTIPFGLVTTTTNGIAAQDLSIATNAQAGYNIYARYTGSPTNATSNTIEDLSFGYNSPGAFPQSSIDEDFGFTTNGIPAFSGNLWAALQTTNKAVATSATPPAGTATTRVGFQAGVSTSTEAGNYTTTIIYTAVPTY